MLNSRKAALRSSSGIKKPAKPESPNLDVLNSRKAALEDEMTVSTMKREAARLYELLAEAEAGLSYLLKSILISFISIAFFFP